MSGSRFPLSCSACRPAATALGNRLLLLGVYGFALSLLTNRGTYVLSQQVTAAALLLIGIGEPARLRLRLPRPLVWLWGAGLVFLVLGVTMAVQPSPGHEPAILLGGLVMATAMTLLPPRVSARFDHRTAVILLLLVFVATQGVADLLGSRGNHDGPRGLYRNIHYMAAYAVLVLPPLACLALALRARVRWLLVLALVVDLAMLLLTHSRPGYLALFCMPLALVPHLSPRLGWRLAGFSLLLAAGLYASGGFGFADRIDDFLVHIDQEERWVLWREFIPLQLSSTPLQWWLGHGFGAYYRDYQAYSSLRHVQDFVFPHNFLLEILYSHGLLGLTLLLAAFALGHRGLARAIRDSRTLPERRRGLALLAAWAGFLVVGFLTLPFFARHHFHPLSLLIGASFCHIRTIPRHA